MHSRFLTTAPWLVLAAGCCLIAFGSVAASEPRKIIAVSAGIVACIWGAWLGALALRQVPADEDDESIYLWGIGYFRVCALLTVASPLLVIAAVGIAASLRTQAWPRVPATILAFKPAERGSPATVEFEYQVDQRVHRSHRLSPTESTRDLSGVRVGPATCCHNPLDSSEAYLFCGIPAGSLWAGAFGAIFAALAAVSAVLSHGWARDRAEREAVRKEKKRLRLAQRPESSRP